MRLVFSGEKNSYSTTVGPKLCCGQQHVYGKTVALAGSKRLRISNYGKIKCKQNWYKSIISLKGENYQEN